MTTSKVTHVLQDERQNDAIMKRVKRAKVRWEPSFECSKKALVRGNRHANGRGRQGREYGGLHADFVEPQRCITDPSADTEQ